MSQRPYTLWLIVLALLCGQASAYAHALGHLKNNDVDKHAHVCELCVAHVNLGSAAPSAAPALHHLTATYDWFVADIFTPTVSRLSAPRARAPPAAL